MKRTAVVSIMLLTIGLVHAQSAELLLPKTRVIDTGEIKINLDSTVGPFNVDGYDTVSVQIVGTAAGPYQLPAYGLTWRLARDAPYFRCSTGPADLETHYITHVDVCGRELLVNFGSGSNRGYGRGHVLIYLQRQGKP